MNTDKDALPPPQPADLQGRPGSASAPGDRRDTPSDLPMPHERDQAIGQVAKQPDPMMRQAKRDIDHGQVDTDMWATPGLDAERRERLVPTPPADAAPPARRRRR